LKLTALLLLNLFLLSGCINTQEVSPSQEIVTQEKIKANIKEARNAKKAYKELQKKRNKI